MQKSWPFFLRLALRLKDQPLFQGNEFFLDGQAVGKSAEVAVGPHHPVAGDDEGDGVFPVGRPNCPGSLWVAQFFSDVTVTDQTVVGDSAQLRPDRFLKFSTCRV